ncbi:MAG TPA: glycerophosphodiester phosphodiesterase [Candidatus Bathyarchaeia archaeon]|nr:glycerophosphodiester phosphodiesterase [Candidatus Bathyarchaeia archaeon]
MAPLRLAHRGDWRVARENTIEALVAAASHPRCDGVEFDVRASSDGVPVLAHDETLERVWGRPECVSDMTADRLETLGLPTLEAALAALPRTAFLDVELKGDPGRAVVEVLAAGRGAELHRAAVSSFEPATLARIGGLAPAWPRWLNARSFDDDVVETAADLGCRGVSIEWHAIDEAGMSRARAADLDVIAWTVRRRPTYRRLARLGVSAICAEAAALDG